MSPFSLVRAPQGLTDERFKSLKTLSEKLSPIERYVSVIIDEAILNPRLAFDSNGMIIGKITFGFKLSQLEGLGYTIPCPRISSNFISIQFLTTFFSEIKELSSFYI